MNFHLTQIPERTKRPRTHGLTMVNDKGLSVAEARNLVSGAHPHVDLDDRTPFAVYLSIRSEGGDSSVWLRIDGGPMQTAERGEVLRFGTLIDGVALLASADARPAPRSATLTMQPDLFSVEALFTHADGSFWRRHFTARFLPDGIDVIVWVFDAAGTRARTWRGLAVKR